jgi:23S rRNA (pseudouridine1915-N3)-methyltransferase
MIHLVAVGKVKTPYYREAIADYEARLSRFASLTAVEVRDSNPVDEGKLLLARLRGAPVVACDPGGQPWDSRRLADFLGTRASPCFLLGGPEGLSDAVRERADHLLSLSAFTLPHELARLVLTEQLYRALTILRGLPYHR